MREMVLVADLLRCFWNRAVAYPLAENEHTSVSGKKMKKMVFVADLLSCWFASHWSSDFLMSFAAVQTR